MWGGSTCNLGILIIIIKLYLLAHTAAYKNILNFSSLFSIFCYFTQKKTFVLLLHMFFNFPLCPFIFSNLKINYVKNNSLVKAWRAILNGLNVLLLSFIKLGCKCDVWCMAYHLFCEALYFTKFYVINTMMCLIQQHTKIYDFG